MGDVARQLGLTVNVVREWSERFPMPISRMNGQRYFPPKAVNRLRLVKFLLKTEGYSPEGARKQYDRLISCNW